MLFAQTTSPLPDPAWFGSIGWVIVILVCIVVGINAVLDLWQKIKEKPTGAEAFKEAGALFAEKERLEKLETEFRLYKPTADKEAAERRRGIYNKIEHSQEEVMARMDEIRRELEGKIKDVDTRVDNIPDRVIATLRNTGALK